MASFTVTDFHCPPTAPYYRLTPRASDTDASLTYLDLARAALEAAGAVDGDEVELVAVKTGRRPFGDRKMRLVASGTYRREPYGAPEYVVKRADEAGAGLWLVSTDIESRPGFPSFGWGSFGAKRVFTGKDARAEAEAVAGKVGVFAPAASRIWALAVCVEVVTRYQVGDARFDCEADAARAAAETLKPITTIITREYPPEIPVL